jgi:hypothetical protein
LFVSSVTRPVMFVSSVTRPFMFVSSVTPPVMFVSSVTRPVMFVSSVTRPVMFVSSVTRPVMFVSSVTRPVMTVLYFLLNVFIQHGYYNQAYFLLSFYLTVNSNSINFYVFCSLFVTALLSVCCCFRLHSCCLV